jgi:hypothetical protein
MHKDLKKRAVKWFLDNPAAPVVHIVMSSYFTTLPIALRYKRCINAVKVTSILRTELAANLNELPAAETSSKKNTNTVKNGNRNNNKPTTGRRFAAKSKS